MSALISPAAISPVSGVETTIGELPCDLIYDAERTSFGGQPRDIPSLAENIASFGLQTPISVKAVKRIRNGAMVDAWAIVDGHRRLCAVRSLGWAKIRAVVCDGASGNRNIPLDMIEVGTRLRGVSADTVGALAASISEAGLLNPITVHQRGILRGGIETQGWGIVAGLHRLEACRSLGMNQIPAHVVTRGEIERQLAECDENLCGTKLTPSERAMFTARRKQAYEALHPETRHGAVGNGREKSRKVCDSTHSRFSADTSAKTGRSERAIQMDASRGEHIDDAVLSDIRGTPLDKGIHLDAIASVPKAEQKTAVIRMQQARDADRVDASEAHHQVNETTVSTQAHDCAEWLKGLLDLSEIRRLAEWIGLLKPGELKAALLRADEYDLDDAATEL